MSNNEEDELLAAAAMWSETSTDKNAAASSSAATPRKPQQVEARSLPTPTKTFSLHVTQLSYDATDYDIRDLFISKGCLVTSVRLCYTDRDSETMTRKFKGVAFVDVADEASYKEATKLHRTYHLGRRINVRPTLSKNDIGRIAEATKEKVHEIIEASAAAAGVGDDKTSTGGNKAAAQTKPKSENKKKSPKPDKKSPRPRRVHKRDESVKLTKKERNRKAAILLARRGRRRKGN